MPSERYELIKVKDSKPEEFRMVWFTLDEVPMQIGPPKSEALWRAELKEAGRNEPEINYLLDRARKFQQ
jgi:hypothetical protein